MYTKYTNNKNNLDEPDNILVDCITTQKKKLDFYLFSCELVIEFDNNFKENIEINHFYNTDITNIKRNLFYNINHFIPRGYKTSNIKKVTIKTINDRFNITYGNYINNPKPMFESRINFIIAKNPSLINWFDQNKNIPLVRKYSHVPFNN